MYRKRPTRTHPKKYDLFSGEYAKADHLDKEGHPSFTLPLKHRVLQNLMTNTVQNTFYASQRELAVQSVNLYKEILEQDPEFLAKATVYAREKGYMRLQPIVSSIVLSTLKDKLLFHSVFKKAIRTPKDLGDFISYCRKGSLIRHGLGRTVKTAIKEWLRSKISEYWVIKYKKQLKDAYSIAHPKFKEGTFQWKIGNYLFKDEINEGLTQLKAFEEISKPESLLTPFGVNKLIEEGRLPYEAVTGALSKIYPDTWEELMKQMPIFALLRHLNTLHKNGIFDKQANVDYVVEKFTNPEIVQKSMILPFRYFVAYKQLHPLCHGDILESLTYAIEHSFANVPDITGKTCIAIDVSGSMTTQVSRATYTYSDIASIFGASIMKKVKGIKPLILPFDDEIHNVIKVSSRNTLMDIARTIAKTGGGGTDIGLPMKFIREQKLEFDNFIAITDNEEWVTEQLGYTGHSYGFYPELLQYRKQTNPELKAFLITISPYQDSVVPSPDRNTHLIFGWSDIIPKYIADQIKGLESQVNFVDNMELERAIEWQSTVLEA